MLPVGRLLPIQARPQEVHQPQESDGNERITGSSVRRKKIPIPSASEQRDCRCERAGPRVSAQSPQRLVDDSASCQRSRRRPAEQGRLEGSVQKGERLVSERQAVTVSWCSSGAQAAGRAVGRSAGGPRRSLELAPSQVRD
eukprot:768781-Hanusia_phi.AAC.6